MIGRREAIAAVALSPLFAATAEACTIQLPLRETRVDRRLQVRRVATVRDFFRSVERASGRVELDLDEEISSIVKQGFAMPQPSPYKLVSVASFGELVLARAQAFESTPGSECNPVTAVHAYYAFFFDARVSDRIAMMDTITYG